MSLTKTNQLRCVGVQVITMGIGTAISALVIPEGATHVFCAAAGGENGQSLWLALTVTGSAQTAALPMGSSTATAGFPEVPIPLPFNALITAYNLRRNVTTAAIDYCVFYYKAE